MNVRLDRRVVLLQPTERITELQEHVAGEPVRWPTRASARDVRGSEGVGLSGGPVETQSSEVQRVYRIRQRRFGALAEDFDPADFDPADFAGGGIGVVLVLGGPSKRIPRCTRCAT